MSDQLKWFPFVVCLIVCLVVFPLLNGCKKKEPIKIGFSGGLTGRYADLGTYGRNGVQLAIEEVNRAGGIKGQMLELIAKDDRQDPHLAIQVDKELIDEGVVAIIGHFTSAMSVAAVPQINKHEIVLFSPTTSTTQLTGLDDYFLRVMSPTLLASKVLAEHVFAVRGLRKIVVINDYQNHAFSKDWVDYFQQYSTQAKGEVSSLPFVSGKQLFTELADKAVTRSPDGILIVAGALDAAIICQQIRKLDTDVPIFTTMWSMADDFIHHGGPATEGVAFANWFDPDHPGVRSQTFTKNYRGRFGRDPNFVSHFAYETASILIEALWKVGDTGQLKEAILEKDVYDGTQGKIKIDKFGDAERDAFIMQVKDGHFVRME